MVRTTGTTSPGSSSIIRKIFSSERIERRTKSRHYFLLQHAQLGNDFFRFFFARSRKVETIEFSDAGEPHAVLHPDAPFVNVFVDLKNSVCAVQKNSKFSPSIESAAELLEKLLQEHDVSKQYQCDIQVDAIRDPEEFITLIRPNTLITKFFFEVRRPNPFDANELAGVVKDATLEFNANKTRTSIDGSDLNHELVKELTRSSASTGDDAGIKFRQAGDSQFLTKSLKNNKILTNIDVDEAEKDMNPVLRLIRQLYNRVRSGEDVQA